MLEHLGERAGAGLVLAAVERVAASGPRTADLGGTAKTDEVAAAVVAAVG